MMVKIYKFALLSIIVLLYGCEYEYDSGFEYEPKVVVNSIISPDRDISVVLKWSDEIGSGEDMTFEDVESFSAKLFEDGEEIFNETNLSGTIETKIKPKEGSTYRLEVDVPDYGIVSAETYIPQSPTVDIKLTEIRGESVYHSYRHYQIDNVSLPQKVRGTWIRCYADYISYNPKYSYTIYATNPYFDSFNGWQDLTDEIGERGSNTGYDDYIRVPYANVPLSLPMNFAVRNHSEYTDWDNPVGFDEYGEFIYSTEEPIPTVEVIAPSDELDKYLKSTYEQYMSLDEIQIFNRVVVVTNNIINGVGIFAGYSSVKSIFPIE